MAATLLAAGQQARDVARSVGVTDRTVRYWLDDAAYRDRIADLRAVILLGALGKLVNPATMAAETLTAGMVSEDERIKLRAAQLVLEKLVQVDAATDQASKIERLEQRLQELEGGPNGQT